MPPGILENKTYTLNPSIASKYSLTDAAISSTVLFLAPILPVNNIWQSCRAKDTPKLMFWNRRQHSGTTEPDFRLPMNLRKERFSLLPLASPQIDDLMPAQKRMVPNTAKLLTGQKHEKLFSCSHGPIKAWIGLFKQRLLFPVTQFSRPFGRNLAAANTIKFI